MTLKKLNYYISSFLPQKIYWYLAGLVNPWQAVLEDTDNAKTVYKRSQDVVRVLKKLKILNKSLAVLDIGCGVGRVEYGISEYVKECVGVDISSSMVKLAKENVKAKNVKFLVTNGKNLKDLNNSKFDLVFSVLVFQHLPRQIFKNYIQESARVLKLGGKIFFHSYVNRVKFLKEPPQNHPWVIRRYTKNKLIEILQENQFTKIKFFNISGGKLNGSEEHLFVLAQKLN